MYRSAKFLTVALLGLTALGCAKHTGSVVSNDPFAMEGDPFQAADQEMNASSTNQPSYAAKPSAPLPTQPAGWSRTGTSPQQPRTNSHGQTGFASTGSGMRFQASAPMPEITAEKPVKRTSMIPPMTQTQQTVAPKPMPTPSIEQAAFAEETSENSGITQASFEVSSETPRPLPPSKEVSGESPVSLEMPVFADEDSSSMTTEATTSQDDEWWNK